MSLQDELDYLAKTALVNPQADVRATVAFMKDGASRIIRRTLATDLAATAQAWADAAEMLWVVLANVSEGDWTKQNAEWQKAAARWRDEYFRVLALARERGAPRRTVQGGGKQ